GDVQLCCNTVPKSFKDEKGKSLNLRDKSLDDHWNSAEIKTIRKKLLDGERLSSCEHCYYVEKLGNRSCRQDANKTWLHDLDGNIEIYKTIYQSKKNNFVVSQKPKFLDIRLGNKCNLSCRMCWPDSSSLVKKEYKKINNMFKGKSDINALFTTSADAEAYTDNPWNKNKTIWK
ncbi:SPASM domain-containing protein, partial [Streptococcus pseudopneumoniae]|uniref:SPASM domain-containing protein n=1 Tax=Streptococcus pseudopneumoniae TaxID=257758 RepID=UPI0014871B75